MSKKTKNIILIIFVFLLSLFLFELFFGCGGMEREVKYAEQKGYSSPFIVFVPFIKAGMYHFVCEIIVATIIQFVNKIDKTYKKILLYLPVYTIVLTLPMMELTSKFASSFGMFDFHG